MNLIDKFEQYVNISPWLQFVGYMLAFGGLIGRHPLLAYIGLGVSMAGWLYRELYPS